MSPYIYRGNKHDAHEPIPEPTRSTRLAGFDPSACGTYAGYRRHQKHRVTPCDACRAAQADYSRDRYHNHPPKTHRAFNPARCGTYSGYRQHTIHNQAPCQPCKNASAAYMRDYRKRKEAA